MLNKALFSRNTDNWSTPKELYQKFMIKGYFDPCPLNSSFDGLSIEWKKYNFVNPPYSNISAFVLKAVEEMEKGNITVMLVPARTDTQWFKLLAVTCGINIAFMEGRFKFGDSKRVAPFPSMFVTFDKRYNFFNKFSYITKKELERFLQEC